VATTVWEIWYYATESLTDSTIWLSQYVDYLADGFGVVYRGGGDLGYSLVLWGVSIGGTLYGDTTLVSVENQVRLNLPPHADLLQNYPNPFNPRTVITYNLPGSSHVTLRVFDILGREVCSLVDAVQGPGNYRVTFEGSQLAGGVYLFRLDAGGLLLTRKMILER
jgi:hypothetical protein